jgi:Zn-dependent M28 family amino/carboxypeptidase
LTGIEHNLTNVIARFEGTSDVPALALCAHWDTRSFANLDPDPANRETPIAGANDGASGVAVLLEIARLAAENPPPRPLLIILFDGEDMGRATEADEFALGSKAWAEDMVPEKPSQAILLDMIGDADLELTRERFSMANCPDFQDYLWELAAELGLEAFVDEAGPAVSDDHLPLIAKGVEAINIIDFEYPPWHTLEDTPDKCSAESLSQTGRLISAFIWGVE